MNVEVALVCLIVENLQSLLMDHINTKPDSLPTSPSASRDESKEAILNLPLIPIIKIKTEMHPRTKLTDGELEL